MKSNPILIAVAVTGIVTFQVMRHLANPLVVAALVAYFFVFLALVRYTAHRLK
jgi:hypothetical protein